VSLKGVYFFHFAPTVCLHVCMSVCPLAYLNESSAVAEMDDRATSKWAEKWEGCCAPSRGGAGSPSNSVAWAEAYLGTKSYPDASSRKDHNGHGPKSGGGAAVPLSRGELGPHLTQCGLGRGLPPYQVAS